MANSTTISLLSGGLDSTTATALALEAGDKVIGLSFDYGQRHKKELKAANELAKHLKLIEHHIITIDLASWGGSSLTDLKQTVPSNGVIQGIIPNTYVPGRNTVFIAIGLSLAEAKGANRLVLGVNEMDYSGYPDCRPDYLDTYQDLANLASKTGRQGHGTKLWAPLINWNKKEIASEALRLGLPIEKTWSCYAGEKMPCGKCDSCRIRNKALKEVGRSDLCSNTEL